MMADYEIKKHTKINRIPGRGHYDEETVNSIIHHNMYKIGAATFSKSIIKLLCFSER
tara:strand:+ start:1589 stop:1759 length:171 start_codon:yes stop_codon:yes gene_type:complete